MVPDAHAPTGICWAYENRTAAIRVPGGSPKARRIEHRVAGGDVNPYLMLAAVLGAALIGIEDDMAPPPPITGNAYDQDLPQMPGDWAEAIDAFEQSPLIAPDFPRQLIRKSGADQAAGTALYGRTTPEQQFDIYLDTV